MSQQAKDIYSGIKKIFPGSRRSGSFSFTGRMSAAGLDAELSAEAQAAAREKPSKKKEGRHSSFSLSGWREKHRASSEPAVVMSLPYGAQAATPKAKKAPGDENRPSLTQTLNNAFHTAPSRGSLFGGGKGGTKAAGKEPSNSRSSRNSQSGFSTSAFEPPKLGARSVSAGGDRPPCMGNRALRNSGVHGNVALQLQPGATLAAPPPTRGTATRPSSYQSSSSSISAMTASGPGRGSFQGQNLSSSGVYTAEKGKRAKKERGMSLSFSSSARKERKREKAEAEERERALRAAYSKNEQAVVKPHASTWDSDSDDDYEDTKRPTRGLDRRSQSMDFMEQAPEHLISKIWRKLPIQARLIGGRGNIDLDLQKDRTSFSRSSEARKFAVAAEKAKAAELLRRSISGRKEPSPVPAEEVLSPGVAKRTRFSMKPIVVAFDANDGAAGAYTALESYDDVLVRVCKFAAHDQRPTTTKVQEFLERSMAFLHGTRTKHGNVVNISNEEIRMWRRLALHDWVLEEVTTAQAAAALGVKGKDVEAPSSRTSSSVTEGTDSDSDSQYSRAPRRLKSASFHRSLSESVVEEEPEEEGDEDELDVPSNVKLEKLCDVVNCCVNFGEVLFTPDEVNDLVRLEFIVEEDGWI
ncbi:Sterol 3-beta-glucosyltransferase [Phytophthora cinnamomi]|uniref:Sterol 3-beta-glucosyltransferase n=1 Tax=Phytophthora cinnamomi TaxID=4785 RepID=UPI00355A0E47|nr:Sterol 3-beta-glucosyltransferase [Phytophthora cinnamomi]